MESSETDSLKKYLEGPKVETREDYGGLGLYYAEKLYQNLEKIHQIDTVTGVTETNGSVRSRAFQVAHELRHQGIAENDIIVVCSRCHADQTVVVLASLLIGSIVAPIDPAMHHNECVNLLKQLKPKMCFCDLRTLKQIERVVTEIGLNSKMIHFSDQQQYAMAFRKLLSPRLEQFVPITIEQPRKKVAFIMPTQGATGPSKLVCLSHHFIYTQTLVLLDAMACPLKILSFYPLSCLIQVILMCVCFEAPVVRILIGPFAERTTCKMIQDLKIDHLFLNTDLALRLVDHVAIKDFNLSYLKCVFIGSLSTTLHDVKHLVGRLHKVRFTQMYCTTETGVSISCTPNDYLESLEKIGTIGKVVRNYKLRVVDVDTKEDVEPESSGELLVAGDCIMLGYFKNISATKSSMQNGYFKTGDLVKYDCSGWLYLLGRVEDLIYIGNMRIAPRELEEVIMQHPFVKDTAVISNEKEVVACVIIKEETKLNDDKLLIFISQRMSPEKMPSRIIFMDEFPTTPLGKIRRDMLREEVLKVKIEHSDSATQLINEQLVDEQQSLDEN